MGAWLSNWVENVMESASAQNNGADEEEAE